jgi:hypothetical protein
MVNHACATSHSPNQDERAASGAHSSSVKKSLGFTRAAAAMGGSISLHPAAGQNDGGVSFATAVIPGAESDPGSSHRHAFFDTPLRGCSG